MGYRRMLKEAIAQCLGWSGILFALRVLLWRDRVLILVYHNPTPKALDVHLSYLCQHADPIPLADIRGPSSGRPRFVITIDDGHAGNRQLLDVFQTYGIKPTIFVCSQIIGTKRQFWWQFSKEVADQAERLKRRTNGERLRAVEYVR